MLLKILRSVQSVLLDFTTNKFVRIHFQIVFFFSLFDLVRCVVLCCVGNKKSSRRMEKREEKKINAKTSLMKKSLEFAIYSQQISCSFVGNAQVLSLFCFYAKYYLTLYQRIPTHLSKMLFMTV